MRLASLFKVVLPVLAIGGGVWVFTHLQATKPERERPAPREKVWRVEVMPVEPARLTPRLTLFGRVEAPTLLRPAAPAAGVVRAVAVREGEQVARDQVLVELDPRDFEPAVIEARAEVADLEAQLEEAGVRHESDRRALAHEQSLFELAETAVARARKLSRQSLGSQSTLDEAEEGLGRQRLAVTTRRLAVNAYPVRRRQLEARLDRARTRVERAELALDRSRVVAPFDGVVTSVDVTAGERVQPSQVLLGLYPADGLEVRARIPARYQDEVQAVVAIGQRLRAGASLAGRPVTLELVRLAGEASPSGIDAFFHVATEGGWLRPGNLLEVSLARPAQEDVVAVPFEALYGGSRVYLLKKDRMLGVDVESVGHHVSDGGPLMLIKSPSIEAGDTLIVTHLPNATTGLRVQTRGDRMAGGAAVADVRREARKPETEPTQ